MKNRDGAEKHKSAILTCEVNATIRFPFAFQDSGKYRHSSLLASSRKPRQACTDIPARASPATQAEKTSVASLVAWLRSLPCSYFCDSCEFLWQALFVQLLFLSQPFSGHKETQNSQEEQWHQPRIDHCHHCYSTSRYQTTYENYERNFSRPAQIFHIRSTDESQCVICAIREIRG